MEETGANVHGIIWELDKDHQVTLDKQEGVPTVYQRIQVQVHTFEMMIFFTEKYGGGERKLMDFLALGHTIGK